MRRQLKNIYDDIDTDINEEVKKIFTFTGNRKDKLTIREIKKIFELHDIQVKSNHVNKYMRINGCMRTTLKNEGAVWGVTDRIPNISK